MNSLWFQLPVQLAVMAVTGLVVYRDATHREQRFGVPPGGVSRETWAGVSALVWLPALYYLVQRRRQDGRVRPGGVSAKHVWWMLSVGLAVAWVASDALQGDTSNLIQHSMYLAMVLASWAWAAGAIRRPTISTPSRHPQKG
ncbi:MAG: hypothetical protein ABR573_04655 [Candidatus Dormibacteria bacterium]